MKKVGIKTPKGTGFYTLAERPLQWRQYLEIHLQFNGFSVMWI